MGSETAFQVPIVDFSDENLKAGTEKWDSSCKLIKGALEDHGCFYAIFDQVSLELCNSVFALMEEQFDLPLETKMQKTSDKPYHSYYGQIPYLPFYESLGIDDPSNIEQIQKFTKILWPQGYDHFSETLRLYAKLLIELDQTLKRMVCDGYGLDQKHQDELIESGTYLLRSNTYKLPQNGDDNNLGLIGHTDTSFFTILHQNNVNGLQVKLKNNGEWINVDPSPSMFLILAGESFQVWSNDKIQACQHRVMISEKKQRYSMGLFSLGKKIVQPLDDLVDEDHPIKYKPFDFYEYLDFVATKEAKESNCRIKAFCGIDYDDHKK